MLLLEQTNLSGGGLQILLVNNLALAIIQNVQKLAGERTKGNDKVFDKNVRQKQTATVEWTRKINKLKAKERMNRTWEYVLLSEDHFYALAANGATLTDICERLKVSLSFLVGDLFA